MDQHLSRVLRRPRALVAVVLLAAFLGACSKQSDLCQSIDELQSRLQAVTQVNLVQDGVDALKQSVDAVTQQVDVVKQEASETFGSDITAIESAIGDLQAVVKQVEGGASVADVTSQAVAGLTALKTATQNLVETAKTQECDLSS